MWCCFSYATQHSGDNSQWFSVSDIPPALIIKILSVEGQFGHMVESLSGYGVYG